jgi:hypothetical protein
MQRHLVAKSLLLGKRSKRLSDPFMPKWLVLSNCLWFSVCGFFFPLSLIFMLVFQTFKTTFQFYFILYPYSFDYYFFYLGWFMKLELFFNSILHELFSSVKFSFYYFNYDLFYLWWFLIYFVLKFHHSWVLLLIKFDSFFLLFFYIENWYFYDFILQHLFARVFSLFVGLEFIV